MKNAIVINRFSSNNNAQTFSKWTAVSYNGREYFRKGNNLMRVSGKTIEIFKNITMPDHYAEQAKRGILLPCFCEYVLERRNDRTRKYTL